MKKIVALAAIASLACGMIFADELAVANEVVDFKGEAKVAWGLDLDAGQHGFTNSEKAEVKVKLWGETTKVTEGDDIWAELKIKTTEADLKGSGDTVALDGGKMSVEEAKLHINNIFVGIRKGSTQVGEYKPDAAIHGDKAFLDKVGLDFSQGIQAGYDSDEFKFSLDFRSYYDGGKEDKPYTFDADTGKSKATKTAGTGTNYTSAYGIAVNAELKDSLVPGLTASAGLGVNLSQDFKTVKDASIADKVVDETKAFADHMANIYDKDKNADAALLFGKQKNYREIAYGVKAAYKFAIDDTMYVKPSVGFTGTYDTWTTAADKAATKSANALAFGALLGWGDQADANAGVAYLDGDSAKKVTPGVGVAGYIPFDTVSTDDDTKTIEKNALVAMIIPSFYLGGADNAFVPNLNAAVYSEIGIFNYVKPEDRQKADGKTLTKKGSVLEDETLALALAAGVSYKITLDNDATVTPRAGFRYANSAYVANGLEKKVSDIFTKLGQQRAYSGTDGKKTFDGDFFNLKAGVDIGGLINNTTFALDYTSANLSNAIATNEAKSVPTYAENKKYYNTKMGTFDVSCKIAF